LSIDYIVRYENRKSLKLSIKNGRVFINAPVFVSHDHIQKFAKKYEKWIIKNLKKYKIAQKKFIEGEKFLFFGKEYEVKYVKNQKDKIFFNNGFFIKKDLDIKSALIEFYKKEAKRYIEKKVLYYTSMYNVKFNKIKINSAKKRWGSCSSDKNLNFSYRLIMCPIDVIDYVIIHEVTHLTYLNHSKNFWSLVEKRYPNYKEKENWLKENYYLTLL